MPDHAHCLTMSHACVPNDAVQQPAVQPTPSQDAEGIWRQELKQAYKSIPELVEAGYLTRTQALALDPIAERYQISIPRQYAALIDKIDPAHCPIWLQALPHRHETDPCFPDWAQQWSQQAFGRTKPWLADAIGDLSQLAAPRLTHRYGNRALLHTTTACALYCRFCFRKSHLNQSEQELYHGSFVPAWAYLDQHPEITELILTGGDPLSMTNAWWSRLLEQLQARQHLQTLRIHTRMLVTLPSRITQAFAQILAKSHLNMVIVSHFNHPKEWTQHTQKATQILRRAGILHLNQSVLLAGVNNDVHTLETLYATLYTAGIVPYYLHHTDWTPGTFHFRVPIHAGRELMRALRGRLHGPAMPHYVTDLPGGVGKVHLMDHQVQCTQTHNTETLCGALWHLPRSHTRSEQTEPILYADFWRPS